MHVKSFLHKMNDLSVSNAVLVSAGAGLMLSVIAWVLMWVFTGIPVSWTGFLQLHALYPAVWFTDILPVLLGLNVIFP